jgi:uncharacterized membrane protein
LNHFVFYLRTLEMNRLISTYPYGAPADAPTLYTDYISIPYLFLFQVLVITMYMAALTNIYSRITQKESS